MGSATNTRISVIIPNYNDAETLPVCLGAVVGSDYPDFEVIVVDDKSTDNSVEIIKNHAVKLIVHEENRRQGAARNTGAKNASGEIFLFIDGDICIRPDTLSKVAMAFAERKEIAAVVGMPDEKCIYTNLASTHFNRRVHFNYLRLPDEIDLLNGSISAVRRGAFEKIGGFSETITGVEDAEMGFRLTQAGERIFHSKEIRVTHHKKIGLWGLFNNDFGRTVDRVKLLAGRRQVKQMLRKKRFLSSPPYQLLSPVAATALFCSSLAAAFFPTFAILAGLFLLVFLGLNFRYLAFNYKDLGLLVGVQLSGLLVIDMLVVAGALAWGTVLFVIKGEKY